MGLSALQRQRLKEIAQEVQGILGGCVHSDGRPMTFAELEDECLDFGDLLTAEVLQEADASLVRLQFVDDHADVASPGRRHPGDVPRPSFVGLAKTQCQTP